jgi:hypothetical protein
MYAFVSKFLSKETEKQSSSSLRQCCSVSIKAVTEKTNQSVTHSTDLPLSQALCACRSIVTHTVPVSTHKPQLGSPLSHRALRLRHSWHAKPDC